MAEESVGKYGATLTLDDSGFVEGMENAEKKMDDLTNNVNDNTEKTSKKMSGFGSKLGVLAVGAVAGLGTALVGAGVAGVKMADDLKGSLNNLQTQTGATEEEMKGMEESLKNIYNANVGESFQDIADSMALVKQNTDTTGDALEDLTKNALTLRDTFDFDVAESTRAADTLMKQFGITGDEAMTLIAQGAQQGANRNGDLLDVINEYGPQFNAIGLDAEFMMDTLITGAQNGAFSIDKVGDAVKEMNIRMKDGNDGTKDALKNIGLNAEEITTAFAKGGEAGQQAFIDVVNALNKVEDPLLKNQAGVAIMGTQYEDLEGKAIDALADIGFHTNMAGDTLEKINEIKYDTFGLALQGIGRNFQTGLLMPLGELVLPILNKFANWLNDKMPVIQGVFETVFNAISSVTTSVYNFFKDNILPIFSNTGDQVGKIFPTIKRVFETVFNAVVTVAKSAWTFFKDNLLPIFKSQYDWVQSKMPVVRSTFENVFNKVVEVARGVWSFFKDNILPILASVYEYIQSKMPQIQSIMESVFGIISDVVKVAWDLFENFLLPVLKKLWDWISPHLPKIGDAIKKAFDIVIDVVETTIGVFEDVTGAIQKALDWLTFWDDKDPKPKTLTVNERRTTSSGGKGRAIPQYDVGTPFVPNDQLAVVHKGEAIIPAKYNPFNRNNASTNTLPEPHTVNISMPIHIDRINGDEQGARYVFQRINKGLKEGGLKLNLR